MGEQKGSPPSSLWNKIRVDPSSPRPISRYNHAGEIYENQLFIFGGFHGKKPLNDLWSFDITTENWQMVMSKGDPPSPRSCHSLALFGGSFIVFGGFDGMLHLNDVHTFEVETGVWSLKSSIIGQPPLSRIHHSCVVYGSSMIIFGGLSGTQRLNDLHFLNLNTFSWSQIECDGIPPEPRLAHTCNVYQNRLVFFGGYIRNQRMNDLHVLDLGTLHWKQILVTGATPSPRYGHSSVMIGSKLVVYGGCNELGKVLPDLHVLDLEVQSWTFAGNSGFGNSNHVMVLAPDQKALYLCGGSREIDSDILCLPTDSVDVLRICSFDQTNDDILLSIREFSAEADRMSPMTEIKLRGIVTKLKNQFQRLISEKERLDSDAREQMGELEEQKRRLNEEKTRMAAHQRAVESRIRLNVGGAVFETSTATLTAESGSMLASMFSGRYPIAKDEAGCVFIDRDGTYFRYILNYLRNGIAIIPQGNTTMIEELLCEARFYQLTRLVDVLEKKLLPS
eukprot:TRINITY_DN5889_c0_g1_i1.p1 TRINITY_DN5889_c0_g1~~TRINITY_DN5889_c0_g1_i1.p1  ORF type:complete len:506 (+),score=101.30 TRINITY_DN5889_c0_g1_i1:89-1606(+)